ncbi:MAG: hypothetical protein MJA83_03325 [Gammaproteobacteria bacterium]|nr:hypothetical protein [Gammaproteobacteria bacterium]
MFHDDYPYPWVREADTEFNKMFKTELWHGLSKIIQLHKTQKRDYKRVMSEDFSELESTRPEFSLLSSFEGTSNPERDCLLREEAYRVDSFLKRLSETLDSDANVVLHELIYPTPWEDIPEVFKWTSAGGVYERVPQKVPLHIVADLLDWPLIKVRRAVKRIRKRGQELAAEMNLDLVTCARQRA